MIIALFDVSDDVAVSGFDLDQEGTASIGGVEVDPLAIAQPVFACHGVSSFFASFGDSCSPEFVFEPSGTASRDHHPVLLGVL